MSEERELSNSEHEAPALSTTAVNPVHITHSQDPSTINTAVNPVHITHSQDPSTINTAVNPSTAAQDDSTTAVNPVHTTNSQDPSTINTPDTSDDESDVIYTRQLRKGNPTVDFTVSSDINKKLSERATWKIKKETSKRPRRSLASAGVNLVDTINIIDTFDRPAATSVEGIYAGTGADVTHPENQPGKRIPKAGAYAEAGVGRARAEFEIFEAEAKGPNVYASAEANVFGAGAIARAEIASASASAGPIGVKVGLGFDTGATVGLAGVEVKVLGIGFSIGPRTSISFLGSEVSCSVM